MGPEQDRLMKRLFEDPQRKLVNFKITPGDKPCDAETLCAQINRAMDETAPGGRGMGNGPVHTGKPRINVRRLLAAQVAVDLE